MVKKRLNPYIFYLFLLLIVGCATLFLYVSWKTPSNEKNWAVDQKILPEISFTENLISINNVRNFSYTSTSTYTPGYYKKVVGRGSVKDVWFIVEPFKGFGAAHTFLSFGFEDNTFLSISVEIRKEVGESFSPLKGLLRNYELMYVIADERDTVLLRANHRRDTVYLYKAKVSKEKANELFETMLRKADALSKQPEFYNTINNTCTTNIVDMINVIAENKIPFDKRILLPKDADYYAYELGLIDTEVPKERLREEYMINDLSLEYASSSDYSLKIRRR